jgi:hypothetical protein
VRIGSAHVFVATEVVWLTLTAALISALSTGCGYGFAGGGEGLGSARTVAIVTPDNRTQEPGVELLVSAALRKEFLRRGIVRVISDPKRADLVIRGSVTRAKVESRTVSTISASLEQQVDLGLVLRAESDAADPFVVPDLYASALYPVSADVEVTRLNRTEALRRIAELLAGRALDALVLRYGS